MVVKMVVIWHLIIGHLHGCRRLLLLLLMLLCLLLLVMVPVRVARCTMNASRGHLPTGGLLVGRRSIQRHTVRMMVMMVVVMAGARWQVVSIGTVSQMAEIVVRLRHFPQATSRHRCLC